MATQGVVSLVSNQKVVLKVITGCDGDRAQQLADRLQNAWPMPAEAVHEVALEIGFGSEESLVVMTGEEVCYHGDEGREALHSRYRGTFQNPRFNPRWVVGTADHVVVINI